MATTANRTAQRQLDLATAQKNAQSIASNAPNGKVLAGKSLSNEATCLMLVQAGKDFSAILTYCKKVYKDKAEDSYPAWANTEAKRKDWIKARAKVYYTIAQKHADLLKAEARKDAANG